MQFIHLNLLKKIISVIGNRTCRCLSTIQPNYLILDQSPFNCVEIFVVEPHITRYLCTAIWNKYRNVTRSCIQFFLNIHYFQTILKLQMGDKAVDRILFFQKLILYSKKL